MTKILLNNIGDGSRTDRASAFPDGESQTLFHRNRRDQLDFHLDVVARHHHLDSRRQVGDSGHIRRSEIKLRAIAREKRRVSAAFLFG